MMEIPGYTNLSEICFGRATLVLRGCRMQDNLPVVIKTLQSASSSAEQLAILKHEYQLDRELTIEGVVKPIELVRFGEIYAGLPDSGYPIPKPDRMNNQVNQPDHKEKGKPNIEQVEVERKRI